MKEKLFGFIAVIAMTVSFAASSVHAENPKVAAIGDAPYASLSEAIKDAKDGDIIRLLENVQTSKEVIGKSITIDLQKHTITFDKTSGSAYVFWMDDGLQSRLRMERLQVMPIM